MARTPLMRKLEQLARDAHLAKLTGKSVEQVAEERRQGAWTRRTFLKATGATLGAAALGGPIAAFASSAPRIAIVGGGIAGLNAALTLADAGITSTIYEASPSRIGGRMHSDSPLVAGGDNYFQGQVSEYCGEFIDSNHKTILHLAQRFGLLTDDVLQAQPNGSTETYYFNHGYYSYDQASKDFQPVHNVLQGQVQAAGYPTLYNNSTAAGTQFDHLSLYDWIEQYVDGGHSSDFGRLLDSAYNQEYGADTTDQSSLNLIYLLGFTAKPGNFSIYGASDERYHIHGGNQRLPETIKAYLDTTGRVNVQMGMRMNTIKANGDGRFSLFFDGSSTAVVVDRLILCMSFAALRTLDYSEAGFDRLKQTAITELGAGKNAKLNLQFDSRYWNTTGPWGFSNGDVYTDIGFQNAWDVTRAQAGTNGIMVNYTGGSVAGSLHPSIPYSNASNNQQVTTYAKAFLKHLEIVFPGISPHWTGRANLSTPFLDPNLYCSYSYWKLGQYTKFSGYEKARQPDPKTGKCHFAGEHCSQDFQGFMEGGAQEGARAASEILSDYKAGIPY